jgi:hypothetical protein
MSCEDARLASAIRVSLSIGAALALAACADLIGVGDWEPGVEGATTASTSGTSAISATSTSDTGSASTSATGSGGEGGCLGAGREGGAIEVWAKRFGDAEIQQPRGIAVSQGDGTILLAGFFRGDLALGGPAVLQNPELHDNGFLARFDASGAHEVSGQFGDADHDQSAHGITWTAAGGVTAVGSYAGETGFYSLAPLPTADAVDGLVVGFASNSNPAWSTPVGGPGNQQPRYVAELSTGDLVVAGDFDGDVTATPLEVKHTALTDSFVFTYTGQGFANGARSLTGAGSQQIRALVIGSDDTVYIAGDYDGELLVDGTGFDGTTGGLDAFVVRLDADGAVVRSFTGLEDQSVTAMTIDASGRVIVAGTFEGESFFPGGGVQTSQADGDAFVIALEGSDLAPAWTSVLGGPGRQVPCGVGLTQGGDVIVSGSFDGTIDATTPSLASHGDFDVFVARLSATGGEVGAGWRFGDCLPQVCDAAALGPADELVMTGHFTGTLGFGGVPLVSDGDAAPDIFLAKLTP